MENKIKLQVESNLAKVILYFQVAVLAWFLYYFISLFQENSTVSLIFSSIILFLIIFSRYHQIRVYADKFEIIKTSPFKFNTSIKSYKFSEIDSIKTVLRISGTSGAIIQIIGVFRASVNLVSWNEFTIILDNGKKESFSTQIERDDLIKVFQLIIKLSGNKIKITGLDQKPSLL